MKTNESVWKRYDIMKELAYVPAERLNEIDSYIKFILFRDNIKINSNDKEPKTLSGIWKDKGFEKIADLDGEINNIRKEL